MAESRQLDKALVSLMRCSSFDDLARALCVAAGQIVGAETTALLERRGDVFHEIAHHPDGPTATPPPDFAPAENPVLAPAPGSRCSPTFPLASGGEWTAVWPDPEARSEIVLALSPPLVDTDRESVLLLVDVALDTAKRIDSDESVRKHRERLHALRDDVGALGLADGTAVSDRGVEFAAAAALLTEREREILEHVLRGDSNAQIADHLTITAETVKTHVKNVLHKMGAANRAELISWSSG